MFEDDEEIIRIRKSMKDKKKKRQKEKKRSTDHYT
jgi:hypothetical protein